MHTANPSPQQIQKVIDYQVEHGARQLKSVALSSFYSFKLVPLSITCKENAWLFYFCTYLRDCRSDGLSVKAFTVFSHFYSNLLHSHLRFNSYGWAKDQLRHWTWLLFLFRYKRIEWELINCTSCFLCPCNFLLHFLTSTCSLSQRQQPNCRAPVHK